MMMVGEDATFRHEGTEVDTLLAGNAMESFQVLFQRLNPGFDEFLTTFDDF